MKKILMIIVAVIVVSALSFPQASIAETMNVGMTCTYFPFNYRSPKGDLKGYDVDVAKEVLKRVGLDVKFICQKWDGMIPALLAHKFDLIVSSMSITEKRLKKIDFSDPYRISVGRFIGSKSRKFKLFYWDGSINPDGFKGVKIGVPRATTYDNWIQAKVPGANIVRYESGDPMYLDLENGRVDVIMTNPMKGYLSFLSKPDGKGFAFVSPPLVEKEFFGIGVGIGLRKGNDELKAQLNKAIRDMIKDGSLNKFSHKYFPFAIHPEEWKTLPE